MRFLLDENVSVQVIAPVRALLPRHRFESIYQYDAGRLAGLDDDELLAEMSSGIFDALVTHDQSQLVDHREALLAAGVHWLGLRQPRIRGLHGLAASAACMLAGFPHALDLIEKWDDPEHGAWIVLKGMQRERSQRIELMNPPAAGFRGARANGI